VSAVSERSVPVADPAAEAPTGNPRFLGKTVLVTGSSRNIGRRVAERFALEGARVVLNAATSEDELTGTAEDLKRRGLVVFPVLADTGEGDAVRQLAARVAERWGDPDILVMCHAIRPRRALLEMTEEEWRTVLRANLDSTFHLCRTFLPAMVKRGGGAVVGFGGQTPGGSVLAANRSHVAAAQAGRSAFLRALIPELSPQGVRINFISPGVMNTERTHPEWYPGTADGVPPQQRPELLSEIPLGRPGEPDEIADAVLWLCSDEARYVNGTTIGVNGGWRM
jgi:3-oxoacyl-[acyl-carrier protein] reductase